MGNPRRVSSVWTELPFMRGPEAADRLREWARAHAEVKRQTAERRQRVLVHDWARPQLCRILGLSRAENWYGFVAPARNPDGDLNTSPTRRALVALLREVEQFENEHGEEV
jgi:hypothetical protein